MNGEFEVEPAFGEKREETLRIAGLKTYFIKKVLIPVSCIDILIPFLFILSVQNITEKMKKKIFATLQQMQITIDDEWNKEEEDKTNKTNSNVIEFNVWWFTVCRREWQ